MGSRLSLTSFSRISQMRLPWVGPDHAGPGRGGDSTDTPGNCLLSGHWGSANGSILVHHVGGSLCPPGPRGRRPPGAGRGPHPGGAAGGTLVGSGNRSPPGRLAPEASGDPAGGGGNLVAAGSGRRPSPGGEVTGAARRHEPQSPLAAAGQAGRSAGATGADLRLV